jgi:hypothetical protein
MSISVYTLTKSDSILSINCLSIFNAVANSLNHFAFCCILNNLRGLSGNSGNSFTISVRLSIARNNFINEARVIPVEVPLSKDVNVALIRWWAVLQIFC